MFDQFFRNTAVTLATGFVIFFFSERLFWSVFKPGDSIGDLVITWLAYSVIGYLFLSLVYWFKVSKPDQIFLAGAFYGWLAEGALVGTLYGTEDSAPFPLSFVCTGLSWHAFISALVGWHLLRTNWESKARNLAAWAVVIGVFWGAWSTFLWKETPPIKVSVSGFAFHAFVITSLLFASYGLLARTGVERFRPRWFGLTISTLIILVFYAEQVKRLGWKPLVILPLVIGLVLLVLSIAQRPGMAQHPENRAASAMKSKRLLLFLMPVSSTAAYSILLQVQGWSKVPIAEIVMYWITTPIGALLFIWAIINVLWRSKRLPGHKSNVEVSNLI